MYSKINTCVLQGLDGKLVEVETDLSRGLPVFNIVGLANTAIKESKERVRTAIKNSGYEFPLNRITINLAPANLKKDGSQLDLSIALGILMSSNIISNSNISKIAFLGELALDGRINGIEGALPMVISLRELGIKECIIPYENRDECGVITDIKIIPVKTLREAVDYLNDDIQIKSYKKVIKDKVLEETPVDFSDIKGQEGLKRALEIAAAGGHNVLILGPPGSGKTMAARRLPTILPTLSFEESIEVTKIYSISGELNSKKLIRQRPFRAPHHTSSNVSLIGGGRDPKPGEVSLAHNGVLFLDELPEFDKKVLEVLRQPMEDGFVNISRASSNALYPAEFIFIASMNPCPCGYYGDPLQECSCSQASIDRYLGKISNPLLDRIDIHLEVSPVNYRDLQAENSLENSKNIRKRVEKARRIQLDRYRDRKKFNNSQIASKEIEKYCSLSSSGEEIMRMAFDKYKFSARTYNRILKISRTIADLEGVKNIGDEHLLEAIRYRSLDNKYWG